APGSDGSDPPAPVHRWGRAWRPRRPAPGSSWPLSAISLGGGGPAQKRENPRPLLARRSSARRGSTAERQTRSRGELRGSEQGPRGDPGGPSLGERRGPDSRRGFQGIAGELSFLPCASGFTAIAVRGGATTVDPRGLPPLRGSAGSALDRRREGERAAR